MEFPVNYILFVEIILPTQINLTFENLASLFAKYCQPKKRLCF